MSVPKLRFKEYYIEWKTQELGDVTDITKLAGYEFTKHINYQDYGEIIALRGLNIKGNNLILDDVKYIDNSDLSMLSRSKLYIGDLLFTYVGTIGEVALIPENDKFYLAPNVCRIRKVNDSISSKFLMFLFGNESFKKSQIDRYTTKSSQPALSMENIRKFEIVFPIIEEQTKIASFLSVVDEKIGQLTQKHELLSQYKQGMMQKLFSQQIRFKADDGSEFGEWEEKSLLELSEKAMYGMNASATEYDGKNKYLRITDICESSNKFKTDSLTSPNAELEEKYKLNLGDLLFARTGASVGKSYLYNPNDGITYFAGFLIKFSLKQDKVNPYFIFVQTLTKDFDKWVATNSMRSGQPGINAEEYSSYIFKIPCLEEQTKIANFLSAIDQKIDVVAQQIEQAKQWKKGLLQQMFV